MTINVLKEDGVDGYVPTILLLDTQQIHCIEGIPEEIDHRDAIQNVVKRSGYENQEFFFGVQSEANQITVGHFRPGLPAEFQSITQEMDGCSLGELESCDWWRI